MNEKFAPIVLAGTNDHDLSILREYAEFWKVPYTLGIQLDGIPLLVTSSLSKAVDMREAGPVIIRRQESKAQKRSLVNSV